MADSLALEQFRASLASAEALVLHEPSLGDPPAPENESVVRGLRGGAAVLMIGSFEQFLRDLFNERVSVLIGPPPPTEFEALPLKIRETSVFGVLERAMKPPPFQDPNVKHERLPAIYAAVSVVQGRVVDPASFSETGGNPDSKAVKKMFGDVGLKDIWTQLKQPFEAAWGTPEIQTFARDKLDEIVGRRHRVAHTADLLSISHVQLLESIRFLNTLAPVLDGALETHLGPLTGAPQPAADNASEAIVEDPNATAVNPNIEPATDVAPAAGVVESAEPSGNL